MGTPGRFDSDPGPSHTRREEADAAGTLSVMLRELDRRRDGANELVLWWNDEGGECVIEIVTPAEEILRSIDPEQAPEAWKHPYNAKGVVHERRTPLPGDADRNGVAGGSE